MPTTLLVSSLGFGSLNFNEIYFLGGQSSVIDSFYNESSTYFSQINPIKIILNYILNQKTKKSKLSALLKKFRTVAKSNLDSAKSLIIFKRIFDSLNLVFSREEIKVDGNINAQGYKTVVDESEFEGISDEFQIADVDLDDSGNIIPTSYRRAVMIVKNGLIVEVRRIN